MKFKTKSPPHFTQREDWLNSVGSYGAEQKVGETDRFVITDSPEGKVATFTVKEGDTTSTAVVNGQTVAMAERTEIILGYWNDSTRFKPMGAEEAVEYNRMTIKLHGPWTPPQPNAHGFHWGSIWQMHGPNWFTPGSPPMSLDAQERYRLFLFGGDGSGGGFVDLQNHTLAVDTWVDWVIETKWRVDNTGYVRVWRRDEGSTEWVDEYTAYNIPTLAWRTVQSGSPHYAKVGYYRSASTHTNAISHRSVIRTTKRDLAFT